MASKKRKKSKKKTAEKSSVKSPPRGKTEGRIKRILTRRAFRAAFLFLVSFAVFIPSLQNGLVWDDVRYVHQAAEHYQSSDISIGMMIPKTRADDGGPKYFRPVYESSLIMDHKIWESAPFGFHLTNIVLHSITTVLLYFLILLLFREFGKEWGDKVAFLSSVFFALYPLHVESVSFISARGDILAAMFFFLCMIFYLLSYKKYWLTLIAGIFLYLSFVSKEVAYSFPIIILGLDVISRNMLKSRNLLKYIIVGIPVIFYFLVRFGSLTNFANSISYADIQEFQGSMNPGEFVNFFYTYLFYVTKLLFPYNLNPFIGRIPSGDALHLVLAIIIIIGVCIVFLISIWKKESITAFGLLWIFATLGPAVMLAIYPIAVTRFAERLLYLPSAGYCLLLAYVIIYVAQRSGIKWIIWAAGGLLCFSFAIVTVRGQEVWKDELTFWENAVRKSPDQVAPRINYGNILRDSGRTDEAIIQYSKTLSPKVDGSNYGKALAARGIGVAYINKEDYSKAEKWFKTAFEYYPKDAEQYHYHMGLISIGKKDPISAEKHLQESIELYPQDEKSHYLLSVAYLLGAERGNATERYKLAEQSLKRSLDISPEFTKARILLAKVYLSLGERENAREQAKIALETARDMYDVHEAKSILNLN